MRGKAGYRAISAVKIGITPAYAGKRVLEAGRIPIVRDHPRLCGEKTTLHDFAEKF